MYKKEVLTWAHQEVMRLLLEERKYVSYAELHRLVGERFDIGGSCSGLRGAMIRVLDYDWQKFSRERSSKKRQFQMRQFMICYAGVYVISYNILLSVKSICQYQLPRFVSVVAGACLALWTRSG